jgi:hypothetical protein
VLGKPTGPKLALEAVKRLLPISVHDLKRFRHAAAHACPCKRARGQPI